MTWAKRRAIIIIILVVFFVVLLMVAIQAGTYAAAIARGSGDRPHGTD